MIDMQCATLDVTIAYLEGYGSTNVAAGTPVVNAGLVKRADDPADRRAVLTGLVVKPGVYSMSTG